MRSAPSSVRSVLVNKIPLALVIITAILLSYAPPAYPQQFFVYTVSKIESEEISQRVLRFHNAVGKKGQPAAGTQLQTRSFVASAAANSER